MEVSVSCFLVCLSESWQLYCDLRSISFQSDNKRLLLYKANTNMKCNSKVHKDEIKFLYKTYYKCSAKYIMENKMFG